MEKKISEEERALTTRFSLDFQNKLNSIISSISEDEQQNTHWNVQKLNIYDHLNKPIRYVAVDEKGSFIAPYFSENVLSHEIVNSSTKYLNKIRYAENSEFIKKDFKIALLSYTKCLKVANSESDSAYVYNSIARLYIKMNLHQKAINTYQTILTKFSDTSNSFGFPYAYFSIIKLLKISNTTNIDQFTKILTSFLNSLKKGEIPLNDSTQYLLHSIKEWEKNYTVNNINISELIQTCENSLELVHNYKSAVRNLLSNKTENIPINQPGSFFKINPESGKKDELMLLFKKKTNSIGIILELNQIFNSVLQKQSLSHFTFEYDLKLIEKTKFNNLANQPLTIHSEFSPYFENYLIQVTLKNEKIINEKVLKRTIIYGIGLFLFIGIMIIGLYLLIQDVKREKKTNKLRADFVSNVTHELKTPLTSIYMFAQALNLNTLSMKSNHRKYINSIVKESEKLKRMINNILEFSKKENDKLSYKLEYSNVTNIVNDTIKEMDYFLDINKIDLNLNISSDIFADVSPEGLKQALSNLISNAIKYSSTIKKINIQLIKKEREIFLEVEDFGIGIPQEKQELIFEKFYRVNSKENENINGTGLGLTVTKAIIEEQNGKLLVDSTLGKGSKFTIVLNSA